MSTLPTRSFLTIVTTFAAGVQGRASQLIDFAVGAVLRAIGEATAGNALWLQAMNLQVALLTRFATSYGNDADSWLAQFGIITRLGSQAATGQVTFARFTAAATAPFIPNGSIVQTGDASQKFAVYGDPTNVAYSATLGGYTMPSSTSSLNVPVISITPSPNSTNNPPTPGANGNVSAGAISLIASPITGIDTVVNSAAFTNGIDQESDAAVKVRFPIAVASLSKATETAIESAVFALQVGAQVAIHEQADPNQATDFGMVTVYVDDGSGAPPSSFVTAANTAIGLVRAAGVRVGVYGASTLTAAVNMTIVSAAGFTHNVVVAQVSAAIGAFINGLGLEKTLPITALAAVAYGVAGVQEVQNGFTVNSATTDLVPGWGESIKAGVLTIS